MKSYLDKANERLSHCKPLLGYYGYRNRVINMAVRLYLADNLRLTYEWVGKDIVTDELRANHYGVSIGASLGLKGCRPRKDRYQMEARVKRDMRKLLTSDRKWL